MVILRLIFFIVSLHLREILPWYFPYVPNSFLLPPSLLRWNLLLHLFKVLLILYSSQSVTFPTKIVLFHYKQGKEIYPHAVSPSPYQPRTFQATLKWYHLGALSPTQIFHLLVPRYYSLNITIPKSSFLNLEHTFWNQEYNLKEPQPLK